MKVDVFMAALAALPTCDASGNYPINRPTDLDSYILRERVYQLATRSGFKEEFLLCYRAELSANI